MSIDENCMRNENIQTEFQLIELTTDGGTGIWVVYLRFAVPPINLSERKDRREKAEG